MTPAGDRKARSFRTGLPVTVSGNADLSPALVATGFSYEPSRRRLQAQVLGRVISSFRDIRRMGAASVDLCSVASGRVDAYYEKGMNTWDYAAGVLIAAEAGATVEDLQGGAASTDFVLAASPAIFEPLRDLLEANGASDA